MKIFLLIAALGLRCIPIEETSTENSCPQEEICQKDNNSFCDPLQTKFSNCVPGPGDWMTCTPSENYCNNNNFCGIYHSGCLFIRMDCGECGDSQICTIENHCVSVEIENL